MNKSIFVVTSAVLLAACSTAPEQKAIVAKELIASDGIVRLDPRFDEIVPKDVRIEKLAGGFTFIEGPLWRPGSGLWFSDVVGNVVRQWSPDGTVTEILKPGGYDGKALPADGYMGPNGMTADRDGAVLICQHGNRRIARMTRDRKVSTFLDKFEGKRLNSPNDLVYRSDGTLFFTDPPYGLPKQDDDPAKELKFNGVYKLSKGKLQVIVKDLTRPNGLALSPDEKALYVANSDAGRKIWMRYDVAADGTVSNGKVFADVTAETAEGLPDGLKVDTTGNVYATGPGGIWVFAPDGKHIGSIKPAEEPANCGWGDDGKSLYMTARTGLYRIKLNATGQKHLYQ